MKIYTSYYAKLRELARRGIVPIAISITKPNVYSYCLSYNKLAPSWSILNEYKYKQDWNQYRGRYNLEVLMSLSPKEVFDEIDKMVQKTYGKEFDVALLCYEANDKPCHRHLVAEWFMSNGIDCKEFIFT